MNEFILDNVKILIKHINGISLKRGLPYKVTVNTDLINNKKNITINTPNKIYTFYSFDGMWYVENEDGLTFF